MRCDGLTRRGKCRRKATRQIPAGSFTAELHFCRRCEARFLADWSAWRDAYIPGGE